MTGRVPPPPEVVRTWIQRWSGVTPESAPPEMVEGAIRALGAALGRPGRNREAAEALLAADALLTYAMEDAADAPDPDSELARILDRVALVELPLPAVDFLARARIRERAQTRFYRALAAAAELADRPRDAERLNELLADEQHHLSRVSARLLELGGASPEATDSLPEPALEEPVALDRWEEAARAREAEEVAFYRQAEEAPGLDPRTRDLFREIRVSEEHHRQNLGGKWMRA